MSEKEKKRLKEYQKKYREAKKSQYNNNKIVNFNLMINKRVF